MKIFYEPVNVNGWNIFQEVDKVGYHETFLASKEMGIGDLMLLYVGKQKKDIESGIYAIAKIISNPYIYLNSNDAYCYKKLSVDVEIIAIDFQKPLLSDVECKLFIRQYRTKHKIDSKYYDYIIKKLNVDWKLKTYSNILSVDDNTKYYGHVDILNSLFKKNYKGHQKARFRLNESTTVWFPKIQKNSKGEIIKNKSGWKNYYNEDCSIITTVPPESRKLSQKDYSTTLLIFIMFGKNNYRFVGAFKLNKADSSENKHVYVRLSKKVKLIGNPVTEVEIIEKCFTQSIYLAIDDKEGIINTDDVFIQDNMNIYPSYKPEEKQDSIEGKSKKFKRDPLKSKRAIMLANYQCQIDLNHKSFLSKNGKPYMEAHHIVPMGAQEDFKYSLDVDANIVSLCPICHRKLHFGKEKSDELSKLFNLRVDLLKKSGINISYEVLVKYYNYD